MRLVSYSSKQAWSLSNSTEPVVTPIRGYKGMCLQASGNNTVQVSSCTDQSVQQWALYPDGTVRPSMSTTKCLKSKASPDGEVVVHDLCDGGKAERWLFNHDRSISDAVNQYVLEVENRKISVVKRSADAPTTQQIFDINFV
ncbi:abrin-d-like [Daucus carota subsp. sativus]|uniref:abrin-d-like n=1 Tax=Daucus carota subsp. sativus TaxID=79200 RepID=UPI0007F03F03|nr:PREDICTED: abrin-d-like [Daucus carota subsp. sativus]